MIHHIVLEFVAFCQFQESHFNSLWLFQTDAKDKIKKGTDRLLRSVLLVISPSIKIKLSCLGLLEYTFSANINRFPIGAKIINGNTFGTGRVDELTVSYIDAIVVDNPVSSKGKED